MQPLKGVAALGLYLCAMTALAAVEQAYTKLTCLPPVGVAGVIKACPQPVTHRGPTTVRKVFATAPRFRHSLGIQLHLQPLGLTVNMTAFDATDRWIEWELTNGIQASAADPDQVAAAIQAHLVWHNDCHCGNYKWHNGRLVMIDFDDAVTLASPLAFFNRWNLRTTVSAMTKFSPSRCEDVP